MLRRILSSPMMLLFLFFVSHLHIHGKNNNISLSESDISGVSFAYASSGSDSLKTTEAKSDSSDIVQHEFNHKEQVIVGGVIMACLALILAIMNNYNPR